MRLLKGIGTAVWGLFDDVIYLAVLIGVMVFLPLIAAGFVVWALTRF